jgi:hypothetical protein
LQGSDRIVCNDAIGAHPQRPADVFWTVDGIGQDKGADLVGFSNCCRIEQAMVRMPGKSGKRPEKIEGIEACSATAQDGKQGPVMGGQGGKTHQRQGMKAGNDNAFKQAVMMDEPRHLVLDRIRLIFIFYGIRLDFDVDDACFADRLKDRFQIRNRLPSESAIKPRSGIQLPDIFPGCIPEPSLSVRGPIERIVMHHDDMTVTTERYVELDHLDTGIDCGTESAEGVFRIFRPKPPVTDDDGSW